TVADPGTVADGTATENWLERQPGAPETYRERMRIGWYAWWTRPGTPETTWVKIAEEDEVQEALAGFQPVMSGTRFFDARYLKENDRMIPLLVGEGKTVDDGSGPESVGRPFSAPIAVIYDFDSDFTGNLVISSCQNDDVGQNISAMTDQAVYLPQAILLARAAGVEKYFWYEFQSMERDDSDKEHHFGIVHRDLTPKPAWWAYRTLTRICPDDATDLKFRKLGNDGCGVSWSLPDGRSVWAIWSPAGTTEIVGPWAATTNLEAVDYLGARAQELPSRFSPGIWYLSPQNP
ncbi:MAG: hypothetical protein Q4C47_07600, partial [Planctomycetia bacterium]|nr:hypothetical protein [Planctomycetia bacterium]